MSFNPGGDHLINGEGLDENKIVRDGVEYRYRKEYDDLDTRIRRLVKERTKGKCDPKGDILLLTNITYYSYCFNPVSFYYVLKDDAPRNLTHRKECWEVEAIVAEVSNTPWLEMYCYVLHPDSIDMKEVKPGKKRSNMWSSTNYIFKKVRRFRSFTIFAFISFSTSNVIMHCCIEKNFHVSPFFEMDYLYDWEMFKPGKGVAVSAALKKKGKIAFRAFFDCEKKNFNPFTLFYYIARFPFYCILIQIWIHVQALHLTLKGVEFIPHPNGTENIYSTLIASMMAPYYAFKGAKEKLEKEKRSAKAD